jgi:hypothetical protein
MIELSMDSGARVVWRASSFRPTMARPIKFSAMYHWQASTMSVHSFLLQGVALDLADADDGIHPNAEPVPLLNTVWQV